MPTTDEHKAEHAELLARLGAQVEELKGSEGWLQWLACAAKFREYSFNNQVLILMQCPEAEHVAGYRVWQSLGRQVRKGERGIRILAPMVFKAKEEGEEGTYLRFKAVSVFDIAQTDGDPLPDIERPTIADMPDPALFEWLAAVVGNQEISLRFVEKSPDGARGWYVSTEGDRSITLVDSLPVASQCKTLLHELAHSIDPGCHELREQTPRDIRELVAESASYIVATRLGLDADEVSAHYVASWGATEQKLEQLAERVLSVAAALEAMVL